MVPANLRDIRAFPDLVRYLEDELDWPLREYGFDELTFEFTPAELGLKEEDAAPIKAIHQLLQNGEFGLSLPHNEGITPLTDRHDPPGAEILPE